MILSFSHSSSFVSGGPMESSQWVGPLEQIESLFQASIRDHNFDGESSLRGSCFRKHGLTEVFRRRGRGERFVVWPGTSPGFHDVPGGALRFRLRAHADVMVFFTATISRYNHRDDSLTGTAANPTSLERLRTFTHLGFRGYWEGGDREPGDELVQAQSVCVQEQTMSSALPGQPDSPDRADVSRGVFLCYKIHPRDVIPDTSDAMALGIDSVVPRDVDDLRMVDPSVSTAFGGPANKEDDGRLLPGWHSVRHSVHFTELEADTDPLVDQFASHEYPPLVIGNTEIVVVADYGPRPSTVARLENRDADIAKGAKRPGPD